ncbi:MAG: hypothetical protein GXY82_09210 [Methanospirillum sp.]|nr:hypothetical protein [Methanospirillum sp.]
MTEEDVQAILNGQEDYDRTVGTERVISNEKFGPVEINLIVGSLDTGFPNNLL